MKHYYAVRGKWAGKDVQGIISVFPGNGIVASGPKRLKTSRRPLHLQEVQKRLETKRVPRPTLTATIKDQLIFKFRNDDSYLEMVRRGTFLEALERLTT